jgi:hypothetical protein
MADTPCEGSIQCLECDSEWKGYATASSPEGLYDSLRQMLWEHQEVVHDSPDDTDMTNEQFDQAMAEGTPAQIVVVQPRPDDKLWRFAHVAVKEGDPVVLGPFDKIVSVEYDMPYVHLVVQIPQGEFDNDHPLLGGDP